MSWLEIPVRIIPALNRILDALEERYIYSLKSSSNTGNQFERFSEPCRRRNEVNSYTDRIRDCIRTVYRYHFPVSNFGKWAKVTPFGNYTTQEIDDAIALELSSAGIDPAWYFWTPPHRGCDGNFIRACYYLLNNVLLYQCGINTDGRIFEQETNTEEITLSGSYIQTHSGPEGLSYGAAAYSDELYTPDSAYRHIDRRFKIVDYYSYLFQGSWKVRYTASIFKVLWHPKDSTLEEYNEKKELGTFEINFNGSKSDLIPWQPETLENIGRFYSRGNKRFGFSSASESDVISEIFITPENLIPLNYQYLD